MGIARASNILLFTLTDYSVHVVALWLFLVSYSSAVMFLGSFTFKPRTVNILSFVVFAMAGLTGFICSSFNFYDKVYSPSANFFAKGLVLFWPFFHYGRVLHTILGKTQWVGPNTNPQHFHWADLSASTNSYAAQGITAGWDAPSAGYSLWMMLLNAAVYFALAWYAGQVRARAGRPGVEAAACGRALSDPRPRALVRRRRSWRPTGKRPLWRRGSRWTPCIGAWPSAAWPTCRATRWPSCAASRRRTSPCARTC